MPLLARFAALVLTVFAVLVPAGVPARAEEIRVPPPRSANNATRNILDGINAIRKKGYQREANQLLKLLNDGRVFYRTTDNDAQFIHGLVPGMPDTLYFGVEHVNFKVAAGRVQRNGKSREDRRRIAQVIMSALHEMIHKDQGRISILVSDTYGAERGFSLHEIEAYRAAMKKYATSWVVRDIDDLLKNQGAMDDQRKSDAIYQLYAQVGVLSLTLDKALKPKYGDKACRWKAIQKVVTKLKDDLMALWFDHESQRNCRASPNRDKCRTDFIKAKIRQYGLEPAQLPPDMVKTKSGELEIVAEKKRRKIDLGKARDAIKDMFSYNASLAYQGVVSKDPRTPCIPVHEAFRNGTNGWTSSDGPGSLEVRGGALCAIDKELGWLTLYAPKKYHGAWGASGGTLMFRVKADTSPPQFDLVVTISGPGGSAKHKIPPNRLSAGAWARVSIGLEADKWEVQGDWNKLTQNVTSFSIRVDLNGKYQGDEVNCIDDVRLFHGR